MAGIDVYELVTAKIIEQMERGVIPWEKAWTGVQGGAINGVTRKPYSLLNQMLLEHPGEYFTFQQVKARRGKVRKGEKSSVVVFWKQVKVTEHDKNGKAIEKLVPYLKYYNVFHISQCDGLKPTPQDAITVMDQNGEDIINQYQSREGIQIRYIKGDKASYNPISDCITLPLREQFVNTAEFYSTAFHEAVHSTGHKDRLNRLQVIAHFENEEYSREELVAEIGSASLMNWSGIETEKSLKNSAAYIQSWLRALQNDKRLIVQASGAASKAVEYILGFK